MIYPSIFNVPDLNVSVYKLDDDLLLFNSTTNFTRHYSKVIDFRESVENNSLDYRGIYMVQINDTSAGCVLEQFDIDITGYLDPNDSDFDGDTILDGVELGLLVEGVSKINFTDYYEYDNLTVDFDSTTYDEYYLNIPHVGKVDDANVTVKVISEGIPAIGGNISISLIKEEINCSVDDVFLLNYASEFSNTSGFSYEQSLDLSNYVDNNTITEYYGTYQLKIEISQNSTNTDNFTLSKFWLQTDTFIQAEESDSKAWYTDPALADTDNDGWTDSYEIFSKGTNPLSEDTDADGIFDSIDVDPCKDVVIKISPISASVPGQYDLQIVSSYSIVGDENSSYYFCTTKQQADVSESSLWTAFFDGTNGSSTELHYYANVDDVRRMLSFSIQLWYVDRYYGLVKKWDTMLTSGSDSYFIDKVGDSDILEVVEYDSEENVKYQIKIKVETIGIEKSNVIAVYKKNGTTFNGHYQEQEKMNIIQLYVNDTPSENSPFVEGPNSIVIPTSLFTETILNGYIQNERLNETFFYSDNEEEFQFISVDREGNTEQASNEVDFVMIRFDISTVDAEKLLDLILTCVINESLDENNNTITTNATSYNHYSTKLNGTSAVLMNLHHTVLEFVPWYCNFSDSPQGPQPKDFDDWLWAPLKAIGGIFGGLFITLIMLPAIIIALVVIFVIRVVLLFVLPIVAHVLMLIIRVILLILFFILLAIELLFMSVKIIAMGIPMLILGLFLDDLNTSFGLNWWTPYGEDTRAGYYRMDSSDSNIVSESWIKWYYWDFFDLYIPWTVEKMVVDNSTVQESETNILTGQAKEFSIEEDVEMKASSENEVPILFDHQFYNTTSECDEFRFEVRYLDRNIEGPDSNYGIRLHLIRPNGTALEYCEMGSNETNPNLANPNGVLYNYSLDVSSYENGLWHYYITTKDADLGNFTEYPGDNYFVGPDTTNSSKFLMGTNVCNSNSTAYRPEGWMSDDFYFTVNWYDIDNHTAPVNVSLCLVPANLTINSGLSNTYGIKKFLMQTTVNSPNYSLPVEYYKVLNFTNLNYSNSEVGLFHYYFEAFTNDSKYTFGYWLNEDSSQYYYVYVKPVDRLMVDVEVFGVEDVIKSDSNLQYVVTASDSSGEGLSEDPIVTFTNQKANLTVEYNMTHYYTSLDGTEKKYYVNVAGADLKAGPVEVGILLPGDDVEDVSINYDSSFNKFLYVFNFVYNPISVVSSTMVWLGAIPLAILNPLIITALGAQNAGLMYVTIGCILTIVMTATVIISSLVNYYFNDDFGALLGFSIACLLLYILLCTSVDIKADDEGNPVPTGKFVSFFSAISGAVKYVSIVQMILSISSMFLVGFFKDSILTDVLLWITRIFTLVPALYAAMVAGVSLSIINSVLGLVNQDSNKSLKVFRNTVKIYKSMILIGAIAGFGLLSLKIGLDAAASYN